MTLKSSDRNTQSPSPQCPFPIPNELLDHILLDVIIENIHSICMPKELAFPEWNSLQVLPSVSGLFRATSFRIYSGAFRVELDEHGHFSEPLGRFFQALKYLWTVSPLRVSQLTLEEIEKLAKDVKNNDYKPLSDVSARRGFHIDDAIGVQEAYDTLVFMGGQALRWSQRLRPARITELALELVIGHCSTREITFSLWKTAKLLGVVLCGDISLADSQTIDVFETGIAVVSAHEALLSQTLKHYLAIFPDSCSRRSLSRTVLVNSGIIPVLETFIERCEHTDTLKEHVEKLLESWQPILHDNLSGANFNATRGNPDASLGATLTDGGGDASVTVG